MMTFNFVFLKAKKFTYVFYVLTSPSNTEQHYNIFLYDFKIASAVLEVFFPSSSYP